jgi:hypothetical protein
MALSCILFYHFKLLKISSINKKYIFFKLVVVLLCKNLTMTVFLILVRDSHLNLKIYTVEEKFYILYKTFQCLVNMH